MNEKLIIDTDIGDDVDDAYAIALLAKLKKDELFGITTVYKNAAERAEIASCFLKEFGADCPVYAGEDFPDCGKFELFEFEKMPENGKLHISQHFPEMVGAEYRDGAVDFLLESAKKYPGQITLVAIGPATNLGRAYLKAPETFNKFKEILWMGGSFRNRFAEWNIRCDVENACRVFESEVPIRMIGIDVTIACVLTQKYRERIRADSRLALLWKSTARYIESFRGKRQPVMHDPLTVSVLLGDFVSFETRKLRIGREGEERGMTLPDENGRECLVATSAKTEAFLEFLVNTLLA